MVDARGQWCGSTGFMVRGHCRNPDGCSCDLISTLRAELEQVKRERDEAQKAHLLICEALGIPATSAAYLDAARVKAAERLAGTRVKALIDELKQATHYDCIPSKTENAIDNAIAYLSTPPYASSIREAAQGVIDRMSSTYKARNGRDVGIQGDDGEKCWIVHSDDIEELRAALAGAKP